jgi:hypothetical protein
MPPIALTQPDNIPRAITAFHLEKSLVAFIAQLFTDTYVLDNPAVNFGQATGPAHPIVVDPDSVTPYDPTARATSLKGKVPPRVIRGRVPRTVTGEIDGTQLPDFPSIIVQAIEGKVEQRETHVTVRIFLHAYDENPDSQGYQDLTNMIEVIAYALTSYGQAGIDSRFPIVLPLEWKIPDSNTFPHFIGEMHTTWQLPSARPLPDDEPYATNPVGVESLGNIPAEHIDVRVSEDPQLEDSLWTG